MGKLGNILALNNNTIQVLGVYVEDVLLYVHRIGLAIKAIVYNDGSIRSGLRHSPGGEKAWNFSGLPGALRHIFPQIPIIVENDANCAVALYHYKNCLQNGNLVACLLNKAHMFKSLKCNCFQP